MWPSYGGVGVGVGGSIAGVRHIPQVQIMQQQSQQQLLLQQAAAAGVVMQSQAAATVPQLPSTIAMQHLNSRTRICVAVPEDEVTADTPLMVKRESTV